MAENAEFSLANLLAQTESEDVSGLIVKLSDNGQDSETLKRRLAGAIGALEDIITKKLSRKAEAGDDDGLEKYRPPAQSRTGEIRV